jgi:dihydroorotate dehydrogenase
MMYKILIRPLLFCFDPEPIHHLISMLIKIPLVSKLFKLIYNYQAPSLGRELGGLVFKNPLGLAAGFDKDAELVDRLADMGFAFVEIGTVTPKPQTGNEKPRLFRLPEDEALINRMGFNNAGVEQVRLNLLKSKRKCIIGGNIGKNKLTPNKEAVRDYEICFERLFDVVDYFVVNVSSPNTPGLRELQDRHSLKLILDRLQLLNQGKKHAKPVFLKIAPDLSNPQLDDIIEVVKQTKIAGVIATNTTIERGGLRTEAKRIDTLGAGGLSGKPLKNRSTEVIRYLSAHSGRAFMIIGVGGIHSAEDAREKIAAGAILVQLYTGFIYEGPGLVRKILKMLDSDSPRD